jgi:hypothetical protein
VRIGAAVALSIIGGVSQFVATFGQNVNSYQQQIQYVIDPVTGQLTAITTQPNQNMINARQIGAQQISQSLTRLSEEALRDSINIPPTVYIDQGARITVFIKKTRREKRLLQSQRRDVETYLFLSITTIHADSPTGTFERLALPRRFVASIGN